MSADAHGAKAAPPDLPRRVPYPTLIPTIIVGVVIVFYVSGLTLVDLLIPGLEEIPPGTVIEVGTPIDHSGTFMPEDLVRYTPVDGFSIDNGGTALDERSSIVRDVDGFAVSISTWGEEVEGLIDRHKEGIEQNRGVRVYSDEASFQNQHGVQFLTFGYTGADVQGRVWVAVTDENLAIIADGNAPVEQFHAAIEDFETMVDSIETVRPEVAE